jgi:hypothetical protein
MVSGLEPTEPMPSIPMGLVFRLRQEQEENRPSEMGLFPLPGTYTMCDGEHERTLWYFRRDDMAGTLEIPREHGLTRQARRIQFLRSTLYGIRETIGDAKKAKQFGPEQAEQIINEITEALNENEPWIETEPIDVTPEWASRPLPKSWGIEET